MKCIERNKLINFTCEEWISIQNNLVIFLFFSHLPGKQMCIKRTAMQKKQQQQPNQRQQKNFKKKKKKWSNEETKTEKRLVVCGKYR